MFFLTDSAWVTIRYKRDINLNLAQRYGAWLRNPASLDRWFIPLQHISHYLSAFNMFQPSFWYLLVQDFPPIHGARCFFPMLKTPGVSLSQCHGASALLVDWDMK